VLTREIARCIKQIFAINQYVKKYFHDAENIGAKRGGSMLQRTRQFVAGAAPGTPHGDGRT
jgi:hypothetical protein